MLVSWTDFQYIFSHMHVNLFIIITQLDSTMFCQNTQNIIYPYTQDIIYPYILNLIPSSYRGYSGACYVMIAGTVTPSAPQGEG